MSGRKYEVAYQGIPGAFGEEASMKIFEKNSDFKGYKSFDDVFDEVRSGRSRYGVLPIENLIEGDVGRVIDLLRQNTLKIRDELYLEVSHCLIANKDSHPASIKNVYSHPQALAQCRSYLKKHGYDAIEYNNTAESVKMIRDKNKIDSAAIGSRRAAELYDMKILDNNIQDEKKNYTRFIVVSEIDMEKATGKDKTSIMVKLLDEPGSLLRAIWPLHGNKVNMSKITSRPDRKDLGSHIFYVEVDGHRSDNEVRGALDLMIGLTEEIRILGSYPKASKPF